MSLLLRDPRDRPIVWLMAQALFTMVASGCYILLTPGFPWWLGALHVLFVAMVFDRCTLLHHEVSHRPIFVGPLRRPGRALVGVIGLFIGQTPFTYRAHHVGMHHHEENASEDLSSTLTFRRDSLLDFLRYFLRFFLLTVLELPYYLWRKRRRGWAVGAGVGELFGLGLMIGFTIHNPAGGLLVLVLPFVASRFAMMAGNWAQHAFIDPAAPQDPYRSIITCLGERYNRRCFNDGFHLAHHLHPAMHWTEQPAHFESVRAEYARRGALVVRELDFFAVWFCLMVKRLDWIAARVVLDPGSTFAQGALVEELDRRLRPITERQTVPVPATLAPG